MIDWCTFSILWNNKRIRVTSVLQTSTSIRFNSVDFNRTRVDHIQLLIIIDQRFNLIILIQAETFITKAKILIEIETFNP